MGFYTLEMARLVGSSGRVVAVDAEPRMIEALKRRARKAGVLDRIDARTVSRSSMQLADLDEAADFLFAIVDAPKLATALAGFKLPPEVGLQPRAPAYRAGDHELMSTVFVGEAHPPKGDKDNVFTVKNPVPGEQDTGCKMQMPA